MPVSIVCAVVMAIMVIVAVITDSREGRIYNWLTAPGLLLGLALNAFSGWDGVKGSLLGIAVGFAMLLVSSLFGRLLGGGDVKLLMAVGALEGPVFLLWTIVFMALAGGILAVVVSLWRRDFLASLRRLGGGLLLRVFAKTPLDVGDAPATARLPYAIPIAIGSLVALYLQQTGQLTGGHMPFKWW